MSLCEDIKARRKRAALTQKELGERIGVAEATVCKYENGDRVPSLPVAKRMAAVFGCTVDELGA